MVIQVDDHHDLNLFAFFHRDRLSPLDSEFKNTFQ